VVLGKWLSMQPRVIIFDEPTRGIDVGAKAEIYRLMRGLAEEGVVVIMISSDMEEVINVSDRVAVMHEGDITGFLMREQFSEQAIMNLAVGRRRHEKGTRNHDPVGGVVRDDGVTEPSVSRRGESDEHGTAHRDVRHLLDRAGADHHYRWD
jgi:ABC-type multidrug transport system ATPase subunit